MSSLRLFVAAYPPLDLARELLVHLASLNPRNLRVLAPDQVHLTLQFIGDMDPRQVPDVQESVSRAVSGLIPPNVKVQGLISLPERGRARLVAAALEPHATLLEIHRRLAVRLARNAQERARDRVLPHITLGRYAGMGDRLESSTPRPASFEVSEVVLVQSVLRPQGAEHRALATFALK